YVEPTIFDDVGPGARIAQEEIFGPVLAIVRAREFDHALDIANDTEFGLAGAVFTADRDRIEEARRRFHVGNLYVNRKCTGALTGAHPFGGFNLSGTDSKAGGPDYLLFFLQAKSVAVRASEPSGYASILRLVAIDRRHEGNGSDSAASGVPAET